MKIGIILGTRPEIVKLSSIIRRCESRSADCFVIHTNQHYSENMDAVFFRELELPEPKYNLRIGSGTHGEMTGRMLIEIERILLDEKPDLIIVQGDTNTVMAGALAASKIGIKVAHVEAGLRSYDRSMPEEVNRLITDHVSDFLFCPTEKQVEILLKEGIAKKNIFATGNTVVDAVYECSDIAEQHSEILTRLGIFAGEYILMTLHRPATVDVKKNLSAVLKGVEAVARQHEKAVVFPIHPRTRKMIETFGIRVAKRVKLIDPVGYLDMLSLQANSFLIVTDSGGIQEEACILRKKCIVARENTERPEAVDVGGCVLAGNSDSDKIEALSEELLSKKIAWKNPFGDGKTGDRILRLLERSYDD
ncbi:MAG: UDP-N-acetylglucosamine 2-epimerase (non-hydrolyzing) [Candidatus Moranbacteria bacterium]|nr:UDP-N-acetylglucosamine 2-epimerase (non-hydrolyzing) [Candidatus Moranbacteria bacterium]